MAISPHFTTYNNKLFEIMCLFHFAIHSVFGVSTIALQHSPHPPVHACAEVEEVLITQVLPHTRYLALHLGQVPRGLLLQLPLDQGETMLDRVAVRRIAWEEKGINKCNTIFSLVL